MCILLTSSIAFLLCSLDSKISAHGEVYSIQHYVIKFVSDLRQVIIFLRKVAFNTINQTVIVNPFAKKHSQTLPRKGIYLGEDNPSHSFHMNISLLILFNAFKFYSITLFVYDLSRYHLVLSFLSPRY
jgi:hypothetical protein